MKSKTQRIRVATVAGKPAPGQTSALAVAQRVLQLEAEGVTALIQSLGREDGAAFENAIRILERVTGRVIVTGMGKSGHVARKIAATMASTGTPAQFVHPAEASHGDLGMITSADAVLALSFSGDTAEMSDLLTYARRFSIPLIGITGGAQSALALAADVTLQLPAMKEACPLGLAPTTSTTMTLALGDAIAVALFERKGFSAEDFHQFHPRGALGRKLLRVSDLMHRNAEVPLIGADKPMADVVVEISAKRLGCVGVTDKDGKLIGIITDGDLRRHMEPDLLKKPARAIMNAKPRTIRAAALAVEALALMNSANDGLGINVVFVVQGGGRGAEAPVGVLHIHDILRAGVA